MTRYVYLFVLPLLGTLVMALIEEDVMPTMLQECYSNNPYSHKDRRVQSNCLNQYLDHLFQNHTQLGLDQKALDWIDSLGRNMHIRMKRQVAGFKLKLRVRKEIRTLNYKERIRFIDAVNALKSDRTVQPNKYDALALLHQGLAIPSAHDGYNFVGWHRYYLVLFENALREKKRAVTVPYFDSTLDFRMKNPADSIMWTEIFMGNGKGVVFSGPFSMWVTPSANTFLRRDIYGPDSSLIDHTKLEYMFKKKYHSEILRPTAASNEVTLESHSDAVHRWIGGANGHMTDVHLSPQDPVFWIHHCYIDYLWEQFRERQKSLGIDPEKDYPDSSNPWHQATRPMDNLKPSKTNIEGYSNGFTKLIYRYKPAPTCANQCGDSSNVFLYCDYAKGGCVSRSREEFIQLNGFTEIGYWYPYRLGKQAVGQLLKTRSSSLKFASDTSIPAQFRSAPSPRITKRFRSGVVDPRTQARKKRSISLVTDDTNLKLSLDVKLIVRSNTQNKSTWDNVDFDYTKWAVAPILISYAPIYANAVVQYESKNNNFLDRLGSDIMNVTVQTDGLTYNGRHIDTVVIDRRTVSSETVVLVAFEKPTDMMKSKAYITVYDSYGDVCQPNCRMPVGQQNFKECSGVVKITQDEPLMYMDAFNADFRNDIRPYLKFNCRH